MIKNYFKIAWRNIIRNKTFSFINVLGLTAGTVCCLYILLYVKSQYGYDAYHDNAASIYRIRTVIDVKGGKNMNTASASPPIAMAMKEDFPEVQTATRIVNFPDAGDYLLSLPGSDHSFYEKKGYLVDSTFFQMFRYKFLEGKPLHSLDEPYSVVLSSAVARKLFGSNGALNQQINIGNRISSHLCKVTGVFDEQFGKSHLKPNFIMTLNSGGIGEFVRQNNQWAGQNFVYSYVKLNPNANPHALEAKLPAFLQKHGGDNLRELGMRKALYLQPVMDIHLHSKGISNQIDNTSDAQFLYLLLTIAFFIQLIACINFVNLTTARSIRRAREIGVRKVVGAGRSSLIGQFLGESVMISFIAVLLAVPLVIFLLPLLNSFTNGDLTQYSFIDPGVILIIAGLGLATGLLAGLYPAVYLSDFKPVNVLKGVFHFKPSSVLLRKGLVVFQFVIAIILIVSVVIISRQVNYMQSMDLGFNQNQKLIIPLQTNESQSQFTALSNELAKMNDINGVTGCMYYPSQVLFQDFLLYKQGQDMNFGKDVKMNRSDEHFLKVMGIKLISGRDLLPSDTNNQVIANEAVLRIMDIDPGKAVGAKLFSDFEGQKQEFTIIGVTRDYNFNSLKQGVLPLITFYSQRPAYLVAGIGTGKYESALHDIALIWKKLVPGTPFDYSFLGKDIQQQYTEENTMRKISNSFAVLAILISCLGLFGLATFTAQQKIKEIGVRKVLGASVTGIASMLSRDFIKLVFISMLIAIPVARWAMNQWLTGFVYKTPVSWWIFALAGITALLIALLTVSFQAIKAALTNPVKSLRTE